MYWIWANERVDEYALRIEGVPPALDENDWNFDLGVEVNDDIPVIDVPYHRHTDEYLTDNLIAPGCRGLLVNGRLKTVLEDCGLANIQYFPVRLVDTQTQAVDHDYAIVNIIGRIDCLDYQRSQLELRDDGDVEWFESLVLKPPPVAGYADVFRLAAFLPVVVVSSRIKEAMDKHQISGVKFYLPEDYSL